MADITPEDVAKGMFEHLSKQADSVLLSRKAFRQACTEVIKANTEEEEKKVPDAIIALLLVTERMKFMLDLEHEIFGEKEEE